MKHIVRIITAAGVLAREADTVSRMDAAFQAGIELGYAAGTDPYAQPVQVIREWTVQSVRDAEQETRTGMETRDVQDIMRPRGVPVIRPVIRTRNLGPAAPDLPQ